MKSERKTTKKKYHFLERYKITRESEKVGVFMDGNGYNKGATAARSRPSLGRMCASL